jgi:hypothetical protein
VAFVIDQGYTVQETAVVVGVRTNQIYNWKQRIAEEASGERLTGEDREELLTATQRSQKAPSITLKGLLTKWVLRPKLLAHPEVPPIGDRRHRAQNQVLTNAALRCDKYRWHAGNAYGIYSRVAG